MHQVLQNMKTGELRVADVPAPLLRRGGVVVRVAASCISAGTERNIMDFARKSYLDKARARPDLVRQVLDKVRKEGVATTYRAVMSRLDTETALGYSCAGVVLEAGPEADGFAPGDRVACAGMGFASHAEVNYVPKNLVVRIPDAVSFDEAAYTTIGAIAMQGVRVIEVTLGETVVVVGLGMIGLIAMQIVEAAGGRAIGVDLDPRKLEVAKKLGLNHVVLRSDDVEQAVAGWTRGIGADAVLVAAGAPTNDPLVLATQICRKRGRITVLGSVPLEVPHKVFYDKELQLKMSTSYGPGRYDPVYELDGVDYPLPYVRWTERRNMESFLDLVAAGKVDVKSLTTHRFPITQAADAYALLEGKKPGEQGLGVLFSFPQAADSQEPLQRRVNLKAAGPTQDGQVRLGLIGAGPFSRGVLLPAFASLPGIVFQGVSTASGMSGEATGKKHGFRYATTEYSALLADPDIDLVVVATQHRQHAAMVVAALQAGKHVFVEKPLCVTRDELEQIRKAYEGSGRVLHVGFNRRFAPHAVAMRQHFASVSEPLFGIYRVNAGYAPPGSVLHREGGRIIGEGCHFIDTLVYLTGSPVKRVQAASVRAGNAALVDEDSVTLMLEHENGSLSTIHYLARGNALVPKERIELHGGMRSAVLDDFTSLKLFDGSHAKNRRNLTQDKGHREQLRQVVEAVRKGTAAPVPFDELIHVTEVTFDAADLIAQGGVAVDQVVADEEI
jgi:predicted dehydrogenase